MSYDKLFGRFGYNVHTSISKQPSGLHTDFYSSELINRAESALMSTYLPISIILLATW